MAEKKKIFDRAEIEQIMPQQEPFLFLDKAQINGNEFEGSYTIRDEEPVLKGHFKNNPVFPGTIMLETLGQLAVLYLLTADNPDLSKAVDPQKVFFTSADGARCMRFCRPKDVLTLKGKVLRLRHPLAMFEATMYANGEKAAFIEKICLTFDYRHQ